MIGELGLLSLILALMSSLALVLIPTLGLYLKNTLLLKSAKTYVLLQFFFIACAYLLLTWCFLKDDFSLVYVVNNSSVYLPWFYKLCALWGGHEGSMLLWVAILSFWILLVHFFSADLEDMLRARVLVVLGALNVGFLLFLLTTSNPFARQFSLLNTKGRDLNPLLQDPGFLFHPPMLYMGYVGFSVAFALAIATLWSGTIDARWTKWARPWTLAAWCCLTAGITLGSWWAYRELGWGGWWFWDPVENASFMPWLTGTALIHSLAVTEKRHQFKAWTLLLSITAFSLSLIGTFLVRSGVLTSVHAFAVDPGRGLFILGFLAVVIGGSLLLFFTRAQLLQESNGVRTFSRESALLLNNIFLVVIMLTVLLGTVYPLLIDSLALGKLSVGAPYFNTVFVPLMIPLLVLMGVGIHLKWGEDRLKRVWRLLYSLVLLSLVLALAASLVIAPYFSLNAFLGLTLAFWIILSTLKHVFIRVRQKSIGQAYWGMVVAHVGVAVSVLGVALSSTYGVQKDVQMAPREEVYLQDYRISFIKEESLVGPNYKGTRTQFNITYKAHTKTLYPEKRVYDVGQMVLTESAIDVSPFRDIYIALGEPLGRASWSVRLYYKPFVRGIWGGGFMILVGGLLALSDRRYYRKK